jgi:hypothetical protein
LPTADSKKKIEGSFYVFENAEIDEVLGDFAPAGNENITLNELFAETYSIKPNGNVPARIVSSHSFAGRIGNAKFTNFRMRMASLPTRMFYCVQSPWKT